jgi:hypothetical protein
MKDRKLNFIGDYAAVTNGNFQVVTAINVTREWSRGNPGFSDPSLRNPVSYRVETLVVEVLSPAQIVEKFESNSELKLAWINGVFKYLVQAGTLPACTLLSIEDIQSKCFEDISKPVTDEEIAGGKTVYVGVRRLAVQTLLGLDQVDALDMYRKCLSAHNWLPSSIPAYIGVGLLGGFDEATEKAQKWITTQYYNSIQSGWAVLAGISMYDSQKLSSNEILLQNGQSNHIGLVGNRVLIKAILTPNTDDESQFEEELELANEESKSRYYFIQNCGLLALAILQSKACLTEGLTETFQQARISMECGYNYKTTSKELLTLAISAQTIEEVNFAYITATHYFEPDMKNILRAHAMIAFAILAAKDRSVIGNLVAIMIEDHDPLSF